ncbi:hypothetical protein BpHYR1_004270 [Brachionus plicatilis]|uniref:Uncharacterized protein n=1 Tax=Brachionus plicatilis TaxID=10195 RepID=A0A3M7QQ33_BRAPC|nr:hypothetical protein BpHYR1_004270 [Brachionus plicatilis]
MIEQPEHPPDENPRNDCPPKEFTKHHTHHSLVNQPMEMLLSVDNHSQDSHQVDVLCTHAVKKIIKQETMTEFLKCGLNQFFFLLKAALEKI